MNEDYLKAMWDKLSNFPVWTIPGTDTAMTVSIPGIVFWLERDYPWLQTIRREPSAEENARDGLRRRGLFHCLS